MQEYRYAFGRGNRLISIKQIDPNNRYVSGPYTCIGCGGDLIPRMGRIRAWHFSHKGNHHCSYESYLHKLAKTVIFRRIREAFSKGKRVPLELIFETRCNALYQEYGEFCSSKVSRVVNLADYYSEVELESGHKGFVADILLGNEDRSEVLFLEVAVTHSCETAKVESGVRIIELDIKSEQDLKEILQNGFRERSHKTKLYNFNKKILSGNICGFRCERDVLVFLVYESGKAILREEAHYKVQKLVARKNLIHHEVIGFDNLETEAKKKLYRNKVREAVFNKVKVLNCYNCKLHGIDSMDGTIFCKKRRKNFPSNEAASCEHYWQYWTSAEADRADEENAVYNLKYQDNFRKSKRW